MNMETNLFKLCNFYPQYAANLSGNLSDPAAAVVDGSLYLDEGYGTIHTKDDGIPGNDDSPEGIVDPR